MSEDTFTRRRVLRGVAAGIVASGLTGETLANDGSRVDGHVVKFEPGASTAPARRMAETIRRELDFGHLGRAVAGEFSEAALDELRCYSTVEYVEMDDTGYELLGQDLPWGIDRVDADVGISQGELGKGPDISVIDTGLDTDHGDLSNNVAGGKCFVSDSCGQASCANGNTCHYPWDDDHAHGTSCAGVAAAIDDNKGVVGVAPEATLWGAKVFDACGNTTASTLAAGIEWTADQGHDVGLMAWGATSGSQTVKDACQYAYDKGVLLVAAAGNDGSCSDCVRYPAAYDTVMAVSATTCNDSLWMNSSTGPEIELAAPGDDVYSTVPGGYDTDGGTSMAASHVVGAAAQLMANGYNRDDTRSKLKTTAEDVGLASNEQGSGFVDVAAALGYDSSDDGTGPNC